MPIDAPGAQTPDAITTLLVSPGLAGQYVHSVDGVSVEQPVVQIMVRAEPYDDAAAYSQAQAVYVALSKIRNASLSGTWYLWCQPQQSVFKLYDDDYARPLVTCQFRCGRSV